MAELIHLVEVTAQDPSRSNLLGYPRDFTNAAWGKTTSTVTGNAIAGHDNQVLADQWIETAVAGFHVISQFGGPVTSGASAWCSVFAKANGRTKLRFQSDSTGGVGTANFDLATGLVAAIGGITAEAVMIPYGNGWYRCAARFVASAAGYLGLKMLMGSTSYGNSYTGDGVSGFYLDRALLELGTVLGDPIDNPTTPGPGARVLRFSSGLGKMTGIAEVPSNAWYDPRLKQPISFQRTMFANARVVGGSRVGTGDIVLLNQDQALGYLRDLGLSGRDVVVRIGPQDAAYPAGYTTFLTGTAEQVEVGASAATIRLRDKLEILARPLQASLYSGTNALPSGVEGTADDIKGQPKPVLFGRRYQLVPVLVNTSKLTYQFHDGAAQAVDAVYDQGVALTYGGTNHANLAALEAAAVTAGQYHTCLALGLIRLGAAPNGRITMDARGDAAGGVYVNTAADIASRILTQRAGIASGSLDSATVSALAAAAPAEIGVYFDGETTRQAAIDAVLAGCGGWCAPNRAGTWQVGQLLAPTGSPDWDFTDVEILDLDVIATRDAGAGLPVWRTKVRYKPFAAVSRADLAGSLTEARRAELLAAWRETTASDTTVQATHLLAPEMVRDTPLAQASDAATEATRLQALHGTRRDYVRAKLRLTEARAAVDLGRIVRITTPRLGYDAGRLFAVVGIDVDGRRGNLTLDLWG